jgi:hypothetical protein
VSTSTDGAGVNGQGELYGVAGNGKGPVSTGINGTGNKYGVRGNGVVDPKSVGVFGTGELNGVEGHTANDMASGVYGQNDGSGYGVAGRAQSGTGVLAESANGVALSVVGKARFSRSGTKAVPATVSVPKSSVRVSNVALSSTSFIIATPQNNIPGVWVQAAVPNVAGSYITIYLNKAVTQKYVVGWMVIEHP